MKNGQTFQQAQNVAQSESHDHFVGTHDSSRKGRVAADGQPPRSALGMKTTNEPVKKASQAKPQAPKVEKTPRKKALRALAKKPSSAVPGTGVGEISENDGGFKPSSAVPEVDDGDTTEDDDDPDANAILLTEIKLHEAAIAANRKAGFTGLEPATEQTLIEEVTQGTCARASPDIITC